MSVKFNQMPVDDLMIQYELASYIEPWRQEPAETFFLYHGYARNMLFWQKWLPLLSADYQVLRADARGCGGTMQPDGGKAFTFEQLASDAIGLMDRCGLERVHWVGESSGGIVGLAVALQYPDRLHSLTLCDTPFKRPSHIASTYVLGEVDREAAFNKHGVGGWCRQTLKYRLDTNRASEELCEWYISQMDKIPIPIAVEIEKMIGAGNLWAQLPHVKVPTLIMAGEQSQIANEDMRSEMKKQMPFAKLVTFSGCGHGIHLIEPERCVEEIKVFIESL